MLYGLLLVLSFATCTIVQSMEIEQKNFSADDTSVKQCNIVEKLREWNTKKNLARASVAHGSLEQIGNQIHNIEVPVGFPLTLGGFLGYAAISIPNVRCGDALWPIIALTGPGALFYTLNVYKGSLRAYIEDHTLAAISVGMLFGVIVGTV